MYQEALKAGGVAVVTGGASGVGKAAATRFVQSGLSVIIADLAGETLDATKAEISALTSGSQTIVAKPTDVSNAQDLHALADAAFDLGEVAVLMNNAGIGLPSKSWAEPDNWRKMIEVNLFGVINSIQAFLPRMVAANRPAVVINTGSKQGITTPPGNPGYNVTKAGVKVATEMLTHELRETGAPISAHLFVPGFTYTGMIARHIPQKPDAAWTSEQTVDHLLSCIAQGDFYVLCPDNDVTTKIDNKRVAWSIGDITQNRPALSRWHPDWSEEFEAHMAKPL